MARLYVKPGRQRADGTPELVRRSHKPGFVAAEGEWVPDVNYYRRRLRSGCLAKAEPPKKTAAPVAPKKSIAPPKED